MRTPISPAQFDAAVVGDEFLLIERVRFDRFERLVTVYARTEHQIRVRCGGVVAEWAVRRFASKVFLSELTPEIRAERARIERIERLRRFVGRIGYSNTMAKMPDVVLEHLDAAERALREHEAAIDESVSGITK